MDEQTVRYYRAILFLNEGDNDAIPKSLVSLHAFTAKRHQAMGLGALIPKQLALTIVLTWLSSTVEGREFSNRIPTLGGIFNDEPVEAEEAEIEPGTPVVVTDKDGKEFRGEYLERKSAWLYVMVEGQKKSFRSHQVKPAGV
jgi:hypothetical protein